MIRSYLSEVCTVPFVTFVYVVDCVEVSEYCVSLDVAVHIEVLLIKQWELIVQATLGYCEKI